MNLPIGYSLYVEPAVQGEVAIFLDAVGGNLLRATCQLHLEADGTTCACQASVFVFYLHDSGPYLVSACAEHAPRLVDGLIGEGHVFMLFQSVQKGEGFDVIIEPVPRDQVLVLPSNAEA